MGCVINNKPRIGLIRKYKSDESGQFAVWFSLLALPIMLLMAYVGDMTYAGKVKADMEASLDAAALAAVINQNLSENERAAFAKTHFTENFPYSEHFIIEVLDSSKQRVELRASGGMPSHIGSITGRDTFGVTGIAASELTKEDVICILALDPKSKEAFKMSNGATLNGQQCSVQINSTHDKAAVLDQDSRATAKSFCISGDAVGSSGFQPYVNSECAQVEDPYKHIPAPPIQACLLDSLVGNLSSLIGGGGPGSPSPGGLTSMLASVQSLEGDGEGGGGSSGLGGGIGDAFDDIIGVLDNTTLEPGTYCNTVFIIGENVRLQPGTYVFQQSLVITSDASVDGDAVTLALNGEDSVIQIMDGSVVTLTAPGKKNLDQNGSNIYAGLAIFQNAQGRVPLSIKNGTTGESALRGESGMAITGTVYLPTQRLHIGRGSETDVINRPVTKAPATSFIAYQIHVDGSDINVAINHKAAGLPAILPRSDEGARLTK